MSTHALAKKRPYIFKQFNWRALFVRILVNALTLIITVILTPSMGFVTPLAVWKIILLAVALGLLNALIKPIIQFLTLSYIFATYGLVVIFINTIILYLLSWLLPGYFHVSSLLWAFLGGAIMGITAGFLESLFGLTLPIVNEESVSEPMRKATAFNERKNQVFPFVGATEQTVGGSVPALLQSDHAVTAVPSPGAAKEPALVESAPAHADSEGQESPAALEIEVVDEEDEPVLEESPASVELPREKKPEETPVVEEEAGASERSQDTLPAPEDQTPADAPVVAETVEDNGADEPADEKVQDDSESGGVA